MIAKTMIAKTTITWNITTMFEFVKSMMKYKTITYALSTVGINYVRLGCGTLQSKKSTHMEKLCRFAEETS